MVIRALIGIVATKASWDSIVTHPTLSTGLEAYWTFNDDDLTGSDPDDVTGNGFDGTNNGATTSATGKIEEGFDYDGTNDYVATGYNGTESQGSISVWF